MNKIKVNLKHGHDRSYPIYVENGLLGKIPAFLKKNGFAGKYAVIADSNVAGIYGRKLVSDMNKSGLTAYLIIFKAGEKRKSMKTAEKLLDNLLAKKFNRRDCIIALGGGVTGDLAGFAASIYMRGIPLIQVPTSLLAMVDSSMGGKTGVNLMRGKNLAGTFYQPKAVFIDPLVLKTLPAEEFLNGFAEIIKYGIITDKNLLAMLEKSSKKILSGNPALLRKFIIQCCKIKASITEKDETEKGLRMVLNFGHTIGHAIERYYNYKIGHGRAIAFGMLIAGKIAHNLDILSLNKLLRINNLLKKYKLTEKFEQYPPKIGRKKIVQKLWSIMQTDKKVHKSKIYFILPKTIGKTIIYDGITKKDLMKAFDHESK